MYATVEHLLDRRWNHSISHRHFPDLDCHSAENDLFIRSQARAIVADTAMRHYRTVDLHWHHFIDHSVDPTVKLIELGVLDKDVSPQG